jgi:hypothetical protein
MSDINGKADEFLAALEKGVLDIIKNKKSTKADKLSAINAGVRLAGIKHKIAGGDQDEGFFGK